MKGDRINYTIYEIEINKKQIQLAANKNALGLISKEKRDQITNAKNEEIKDNEENIMYEETEGLKDFNKKHFKDYFGDREASEENMKKIKPTEKELEEIYQNVTEVFLEKEENKKEQKRFNI